MGNLFKIIKEVGKEEICERLKYFSTDKKVIKELGESIIVESNQFWVFAINSDYTVGFICYKNNKILYAYILPSYRRMGIFTSLYAKLPKKNWEVNSSIMAIPAYQKLGFEIVKKYKICAKMKLKNNG